MRLRVLVVEDSAVTREYVAELLGEDPGLEVVAMARDGLEALDLVARLRPDVVLMDVHMPRMDGHEATRRIMESTPTPIVMMSASLDPSEVALSFETLETGALTIVEKPPAPGHPRHAETVRSLVQTVKAMAEVKVVRRWPRRAPLGPAPSLSRPGRRIRLVAVGASTGGPAAVHEILRVLPAELGVPLLLVQHIAQGFTPGLVEWLGHGTPLAVKLAESDEPARPGAVHVAPEGMQMGITPAGRIALRPAGADDLFSPSVAHLFESVAASYGPSALGVLLTGMGRDGAAGLRRLRDAGAVTIAQDEESSIVWGMPQEAIRLGAAEHVMPPSGIAEAIRSLAGAAE